SGYRFITLQGEMLEPDGTLTVGTHHAETGILSRKSELRELRERSAEVDAKIQTSERELADLRDRIATADSRIEQAQREIDVLAEQAADLRSRIGQHRQRRDGLHEEVTLSRTEIIGIEVELQSLRTAWQEACSEAARCEARVQELQERLRQEDAELHDRERQRHAQQEEVTRAKVALGQVEERLTAVKAKHEQFESDLAQRVRERQEGEQQFQTARARLAESQRIMLNCTATLAQGYLDKEGAERQLASLTADREERRQERQSLVERAQSIRADWRGQQEQAHARELEVNDLRHRRDSLTERLREDYQITLRLTVVVGVAEAVAADGQPLAAGAIPDDQRQEVEEEITELRRKLGR